MVANPSKRLLGELLVEKGVITRQQLWEALRVQSKTGDRLGQVLIEQGFVREKDIEYIIGMQRVSLADLDPEIVSIVPEQLVKRYKIIPLQKEGKKLLVAMSDPNNVVAIDDLRLITGLDIEPVSVDTAEILAYIQQHYGLPEIDKAFDEFENDVRSPEQEAVSLEDESMANEAPIIRLVNNIITRAIADQASDIHIESRAEGVRVRYRIDGILREIMQLPNTIKAAVISRIKIMSKLDIAERRIPQDGRILLRINQKDYDLRVSALPTVYGEKVVIRVLDKTGMINVSLEQLGFQVHNLKKLKRMLLSNYGIVLITGPTARGMKLRQFAIGA